MSVEDPKRLRILDEYERRLGVIQRSNGYLTNAGLTIFMGFIPTTGPADATEMIAVMPKEDAIVSEQLEKWATHWPINIAAIAAPTLTRPWATVERILMDIKRAMELPDRSLNGLLIGGTGITGLHRGTTEIYERTSGSDLVGVEITYVNPLSESWGHPEA